MNCPSCGQENPGGAQFCKRCATKISSPPDHSISQAGFVGRQREMGELQSALEEALSGKARLVMLAGEPGIGKTRTAQELAAYAETRGAQALWGRCYEEEGAPPYWPWVQLLRSYLERANPEQLRSDMGLGASDIGDMLPELREKLPDLEPTPTFEPEQARFRLFNSITSFLKNASHRTPLVLVLDDLHWADRSSLLLLQFLSQQLVNSHLMAIGTYRDVEVGFQHLLSETLAQLTREPVFLRQSLRGLSLEDAGKFIELTAGVRPTQQLINAVYTRTEGNPFFTAEVVRLLFERGELKEAEGAGAVAAAIPAGVLEVIGRRLNRLSSHCHQTLTVAAVVGREFDFRLLSILSEGMSEDQLLDVIDEALEAHLIEELPAQEERYQFCHALIQETLTKQLSSSRRVRQHARIADALEKMYGVNIEPHAAELAHHFGAAETLLGSEKLVNYSLIAGEQALATFAWEEALQCFERGLAAKEGQSVDAQTAALLFGLGRAQIATLDRHEMQKAIVSLSRAFDYYAQTGEVDRTVAIAEYPFFPMAGQRTGYAQLIARALALAPSDSREAARLLSRYSWVIEVEEANYLRAQEAFSMALTIAQSQGDAALEMRVLADGANVNLYQLRWPECLDKALQAIALSYFNNDPHAELLARYSTALAQIALGDLEGLRLTASALLASAERLRDRFWMSMALRANEDLFRLSGDWQAAREFSNRGLEVSPWEPRSLSTRCLLEHEAGNFSEGEVFLERLQEATRQTVPGPTVEHGHSAMTIPMIGRITGVMDLFDVAEAAGRAVVSSPFATPAIAAYGRLGLALLAIQRGDVAAAGEQYAAMESQRGTMLILALTSFDRVLGLLCITMGHLEQAMTHFEEALTFCRKAGYRPELAWACHDYADFLLHGASPDPKRAVSYNRDKAILLLEEGLTISSELGMRPLIARVLDLKERVESLPAQAPIYPDGLTQREVEVLRLIAAGKNNREIADELVISLGTVANHVTSILNKARMNNRTEAAGYAIRQGLA